MTEGEWGEGIMAFMQANPQLRPTQDSSIPVDANQVMMRVACTYAKSLPRARLPLGLEERLAECSTVGVTM